MSGINLEKLILFDNVRGDALAAQAAVLSDALEGETPKGFGKVDKGKILRAYYGVQRGLLAERSDAEGALTYWRRHVSRLVAEGENAFSLLSERGESDPGMLALAAAEMPILRALYVLDWQRVAAALGGGGPCVAAMRPPADARARATDSAGDGEGASALDRILQTQSDLEAAAALAAHYARAACGAFGRYAAFYWRQGLVGVERPDPVSFDDLIGYGLQKEQIIENTEFFVSGRPYNNMLLYGDRGTGKSSSVKALLTAFKSRGLRLVALPKAEIDALATLTDALAPRG
jgi:Cdc6-like AAA superfamily ATPase